MGAGLVNVQAESPSDSRLLVGMGS